MNRLTLLQILDHARWAPSGDNTQPWQFDIVANNHIAVHGFDTRDHVLYDFQGAPSQMAHGALLETIRIAATAFQLRAQWHWRAGSPENRPIYDVYFTFDECLEVDPRFSCIEKRVVQRRPMRMLPLTPEQRHNLSEAVGESYSVLFFETFSERCRIAKLLWDSAFIRLTCHEAYEVHRNIIEWGVDFSEDRLPERAVGVDRMTAHLMKWVMQSWGRVDFFNRYLMGTILPRVQLDLVPALACAAHLVLLPKKPQQTLLDHVEAGVAMQKLWLACTAADLFLQPEMTPVIFRWYSQSAQRISAHSGTNERVRLLEKRFALSTGVAKSTPVAFFCRVGRSNIPTSRSIRKNLEQLLINK